jgi:uracil-DNA glycosylase family 4
VRIGAAVRCAPPANKPTPAERDNCAPYLHRELEILDEVRVVVALGSFGWEAVLRSLASLGAAVPVPKPRFGHLAEVAMDGPGAERWTLLGSYHPSQQNTFTGRLTPAMFDAVIERAKDLAASAG